MALEGSWDGKEWLQHSEEEFIFNEALVTQKFNDVNEIQADDESKANSRKRIERGKEVRQLGSSNFGCTDSL
jgi:hypothetical protein